MRHAIRILALASVLATTAAGAAPHGGGMGGGFHPMTSPMSGHTSLAPMTSPSPALRGPVSTGQPMQSCQAGANYPLNTPGNSFNAPGSAFNPNGVAGSNYAGTQPQNSRNTASVAQYDVACSH